MDATTALLGILVVGGAALAMSGKKDGKTKVERGKDDVPGGSSDRGYPIVPSLKPSPRMILPIKAGHLTYPAGFSVDSYNKAPEVTLYPAIFADQTWLYVDEIEADYKTLATWLDKQGMGQGGTVPSAIAQNVMRGPVVGEVEIFFDDGLPAPLRGFTFWQLSAGKNGSLQTNLDSAEFAKYPKFRDSIRKILDRSGVKPPGFFTKGGQDSPPDHASLINPDRPETWLLSDVDGPANVSTPRGPLFVPDHGRIRNHRGEYIVQNGDYTGAIIAAKWGKNASWANAIAASNPNEKFGGENNTVHPGDVLLMPWKFLDPSYKESYAGGGGGSAPAKPNPKQKSPDDQNIPPMPSETPPPGMVWAFDENTGWTLAKQTPPPPTDRQLAPDEYWYWDGDKWVVKVDPDYYAIDTV